jgi:hypothetical protein
VGVSTYVFIKAFKKKIISVFKKREKVYWAKLGTMFPFSPTALLPEKKA